VQETKLQEQKPAEAQPEESIWSKIQIGAKI
jgi:hypothetical protein